MRDVVIAITAASYSGNKSAGGGADASGRFSHEIFPGYGYVPFFYKLFPGKMDFDEDKTYLRQG